MNPDTERLVSRASHCTSAGGSLSLAAQQLEKALQDAIYAGAPPRITAAITRSRHDVAVALDALEIRRRRLLRKADAKEHAHES